MPHHRLTLRLTAPVILISVVLLALAGVTAWYIHTLQRETTELLECSVDVMRAAEELDRAAHEVETTLNRFLVTREPGYFDAVHPLSDRMRLLLREMGDLPLPLDPRHRQMVRRIRTQCLRFFGEFDELARRSVAAERHRAVRALVEDRIRVRLRAPVQEYLQYAQGLLTDASQSHRRVAGFMGFGLLALGACGAGAGLIAGYGIARRITRSIVQLRVPIRDVAGKLNRVVGPVNVSASQGLEDFEAVLTKIAAEVETVVNRLQQSQQDALRAEQLAAVGQLAAGMAHELLNPLTAIKMIVQSALEKGDSGSVRDRDLAVLHEQITRQEGAIRSFLEYARPRKLESRPFDVRQSVDEAVELADARAKRQDVEIEWERPDEPVTIEGDSEQLGRVFLNLILNALDALPGGGLVKVAMERTTHEGERGEGESGRERESVLVKVSDNGSGLPELGEKIFEPFVSTKETGMGLGLSISRRIVEMHGGTISAGDELASGRPAGGAVFTVRLPLTEGLGRSSVEAGPLERGLTGGVKTRGGGRGDPS